MIAKSIAFCCLLIFLFMETPVFGQSQDEINKIANSIRNPLLEKKPSKEELKKVKEHFENNRKARPGLIKLLGVKTVSYTHLTLPTKA